MRAKTQNLSIHNKEVPMQKSAKAFVFVVSFLLFLQMGCCPEKATSLAVPLHPQETSWWCWAASAQMCMDFLGHNIAQCVQANNRLGFADCCNNPTPAHCIQGGWPEFPKYDFSADHTTDAALSWDQVKKQISPGASPCRGTPFCFTWHWPGGSGHVMVAIGYKTEEGENFVEVNDPGPPNVGDHYWITYDYYVEHPGHHTHWDDYYNITYTGGP